MPFPADFRPVSQPKRPLNMRRTIVSSCLQSTKHYDNHETIFDLARNSPEALPH
jgi:hypothetical protein